ncbi:MAG TPA: YceI family protein [Burkholderiales bacterium]|nr:YceI family protein [Burkholderiales bacterium]
MKTRLATILIGAAVALPAAAADSYTVDPAHTYPNFEINHLGFSTMHGRFGATTGKITLDPAAKSGSIDITIDATSINTGHEKRDAHLKTEEFFDVAKFPTLTYKATKLKFNGDKLAGADGELTMHGVTKPVALTITAFNCANHPMTKKPVCGANATATLKRSDFGISTYVPAVGDEVKITIEVEAGKD